MYNARPLHSHKHAAQRIDIYILAKITLAKDNALEIIGAWLAAVNRLEASKRVVEEGLDFSRESSTSTTHAANVGLQITDR